MQRIEVGEVGLLHVERRCWQCQKTKALPAFSQQKGKTDERKKICQVCEQWNQQERHHRVESQRLRWHQQQGREESKLQDRARKVALRQSYEQRQQEKECWFLQQQDRRCSICHQLLSFADIEVISSKNSFTFHTRCTDCREVLRIRHLPPCCLCQEKTTRRNFLSVYDGYTLSGNGACISLCCRGCEAAFRALPVLQQAGYIRACCRRSFSAGQVIYAEVDPETGELRYVGRTNRPQRRHAQHLSDTSPTIVRWGTERKVWYTRGNWMHALREKGLQPSMQILYSVEDSSQVIEWEQRFIWYGVQQGWQLLNGQAMNETLVARARTVPIDFLQVPFEQLVQQEFFSSHGLAAFLHKWHLTENVLLSKT